MKHRRSFGDDKALGDALDFGTSGANVVGGESCDERGASSFLTQNEVVEQDALVDHHGVDGELIDLTRSVLNSPRVGGSHNTPLLLADERFRFLDELVGGRDL